MIEELLAAASQAWGWGARGEASIPGGKSVLTDIPRSLQSPSETHPRGVNKNEQKMLVDETYKVKCEKGEESHRTEMGFH